MLIPKCGTGAGHKQHRRNGETICAACAEAHATERLLYKNGDRPAPTQSEAEREIVGRHYDAAPWMARAACDGADPAIFFPERGADTSEAKRMCGLCPVRRDCLDYAVEHGEKAGIWGGKTEKERRPLRAQRRRERNGMA